jgi:hypothetical protein
LVVPLSRRFLKYNDRKRFKKKSISRPSKATQKKNSSNAFPKTQIFSQMPNASTFAMIANEPFNMTDDVSNISPEKENFNDTQSKSKNSFYLQYVFADDK